MKTIHVKRIGLARLSHSYIYKIDRNGFETLTVTHNVRKEIKRLEPDYKRIGEKYYRFVDTTSMTYDLFLRDAPKAHTWVLEKLRAFSETALPGAYTVELSRTEPIKLIPMPDVQPEHHGKQKNPVGRPKKPKTPEAPKTYKFYIKDGLRVVSREVVEAASHRAAVCIANAFVKGTPFKRSRLKRIT